MSQSIAFPGWSRPTFSVSVLSRNHTLGYPGTYIPKYEEHDQILVPGYPQYIPNEIRAWIFFPRRSSKKLEALDQSTPKRRGGKRKREAAANFIMRGRGKRVWKVWGQQQKLEPETKTKHTHIKKGRKRLDAAFFVSGYAPFLSAASFRFLSLTTFAQPYHGGP